MDEYKVNGIVISAIDYKENDKLITIFSLELGKITAQLKSVKKTNAKLKYAGQMFCFGEFELAKSADFFTVKNLALTDSFYDLTQDYNKFLIGEMMLEIINLVTLPGQINEYIFINTLKCLKFLAYDNVNEFVILTKFILNILKVVGYEINFNKCNECGEKFTDTFFNYGLGFITYGNCKGMDNSPISKKQFNDLKIINNCDIEKLQSIKIKSADLFTIILILKRNLENKFNKNLKTFKSLII